MQQTPDGAVLLTPRLPQEIWRPIWDNIIKEIAFIMDTWIIQTDTNHYGSNRGKILLERVMVKVFNALFSTLRVQCVNDIIHASTHMHVIHMSNTPNYSYLSYCNIVSSTMILYTIFQNPTNIY